MKVKVHEIKYKTSTSRNITKCFADNLAGQKEMKKALKYIKENDLKFNQSRKSIEVFKQKSKMNF